MAEQQLVDCSKTFGNQGCNGGWMDYGFKYFQVNGSMKTADYPYTARDGVCKNDASKQVAKVVTFTDVPANNPLALYAAAAAGTVSVAIDASAFFSYVSGIMSSGCSTSLDHGVAVVGYGTQGTQNFWIVRNSWGTNWGEQGYVRMLNTGVNNEGTCGINMKASYVATT